MPSSDDDDQRKSRLLQIDQKTTHQSRINAIKHLARLSGRGIGLENPPFWSEQKVDL